MNIFKKVPHQICAVALGLAVLGNLLQGFSQEAGNFCSNLSAILLVLFLLKCICCPKTIIKDVRNVVLSAITATIPMTLMFLSVYAKPKLGDAALYIWQFALVLHLAILVFYTLIFVKAFSLSRVYASIFIPYCGLSVIAITGPEFGKSGLGMLAFWFSFITFFALLVILAARYFIYKGGAKAVQPLFCIICAPMAMCLAGYIKSAAPASKGFVLTMFTISLCLYAIVLKKLKKYLKQKFCPSYSAFTFPFAFNALASKLTVEYLNKIGQPINALEAAIYIETFIAVLLVAYTCLRYLIFILKPAKK